MNAALNNRRIIPYRQYTRPGRKAKFDLTDWALPAALILGLSAMSMGNQITQSAVTFVLIAAGFLRLWTRPSEWFLPIISLSLSICSLTVSILIYSYHIDVYYMLGEFKWVLPFFLTPLFISIFDKVRTGTGFAGIVKVIRRLLKIQIISVIIFSGIALIFGQKRDTVIYGFSINAAYSIVYIIGSFFFSITKRWGLLIIVAVGLLGSTTATFVALVIVGLKLKLNLFAKFLFGAGSVFAFYVYSLLFRAKDFANADFSTIDRGEIVRYYLYLISSQFRPLNYIFGWGNGHQFDASKTSTGMKVIDGWFLPVFTNYRVFSFGTHNEALRLFIDYGALGALAIYVLLSRILPLKTVILILVLGLTNTTLFSSNNVYTISMIAGAYIVARRLNERVHRGVI